MLLNCLKTAIRGFWRQRTYSLINVAGLSVGLACSFLILLWLVDELGVNRFHHEGDRIYRVMRNYHATEIIHTWHSMPKPVADYFDDSYPQITHTVLVTWAQRAVFSKGDGDSFTKHGNCVSPDFLQVFTFPLIEGDPATALENPDAIAISTELAEAYF